MHLCTRDHTAYIRLNRDDACVHTCLCTRMCVKIRPDVHLFARHVTSTHEKDEPLINGPHAFSTVLHRRSSLKKIVAICSSIKISLAQNVLLVYMWDRRVKYYLTLMLCKFGTMPCLPCPLCLFVLVIVPCREMGEEQEEDVRTKIDTYIYLSFSGGKKHLSMSGCVCCRESLLFTKETQSLIVASHFQT